MEEERRDDHQQSAKKQPVGMEPNDRTCHMPQTIHLGDFAPRRIRINKQMIVQDAGELQKESSDPKDSRYPMRREFVVEHHMDNITEEYHLQQSWQDLYPDTYQIDREIERII